MCVCVCGCVRERERERERDVCMCVCVCECTIFENHPSPPSPKFLPHLVNQLINQLNILTVKWITLRFQQVCYSVSNYTDLRQVPRLLLHIYICVCVCVFTQRIVNAAETVGKHFFDDRLYSTILGSLEQTHCARMRFYMSD